MSTLTDPRPASALSRLAGDTVTLWCVFVLVHVWLALYNIAGPGYPINDVAGVYLWWVDRGTSDGYWVGIDGAFVYPLLALVPMLAAAVLYPVFGAIPGLDGLTDGSMLYIVSWLLLIVALDAVALAVLIRRERGTGRFGAAWWWVLFLLLLGPIALSRIDSVTVPIAIVAVTLVASRPRVAAFLLTIAAWMKVWPGAVVIALVVVARNRMRYLSTAVLTSAAIVVVALALGSGADVFSFVTEQTGRGLQIEAPVSTAWLWRAWAGVPGTSVYYDGDILTWQVQGAGVDAASAVMTPLLVLVVGLVAALAIVLVRRGAVASAILPPLVLALLAGLISFQKVGSPQFISWLAVPVVLGLVTRASGAGPSFRAPATLVLVIGAFTQLVYPMFYGRLLGLEFGMLVVLSLRNVLPIALFVLAVLELLRASRWRPADMGEWTSASPATSSREMSTRDMSTPDNSTPPISSSPTSSTVPLPHPSASLHPSAHQPPPPQEE